MWKSFSWNSFWMEREERVSNALDAESESDKSRRGGRGRTIHEGVRDKAVVVEMEMSVKREEGRRADLGSIFESVAEASFEANNAVGRELENLKNYRRRQT